MYLYLDRDAITAALAVDIVEMHLLRMLVSTIFALSVGSSKVLSINPTDRPNFCCYARPSLVSPTCKATRRKVSAARQCDYWLGWKSAAQFDPGVHGVWLTHLHE